MSYRWGQSRGMRLVLAVLGVLIAILLSRSLMSARPTRAESPSLVIVKAASPDPVVAGGRLTYILTITNTGDVPLAGVVVTDAIPLEARLVNVGQSEGRWWVHVPDEGQPGTVMWLAGEPLLPGRAYHLPMTVVVASGASGPVVNAAYGARSGDGRVITSGPPLTTEVIRPTPTPTPVPTAVTPTVPPAPSPTPVPVATRARPFSTASVPQSTPTQPMPSGSAIGAGGLLIVGFISIAVAALIAWVVNKKK